MVTLPGDKATGTRLPGPILRRSSWRYACRHPWQTWLGFLGIMLGVMMVVAVDLANNSAREAFSLSVAAVNGSITHQIVGGSEGIPDDIYTGLRVELGVRRSAPSLSGQLRVRGRSLTLIGIDAISESELQRQRPGLGRLNSTGGEFVAAFGRENAVLLSERSAAALGLGQGDSFAASRQQDLQELYLAAVFSSDNPAATEGLMFADIAVAQRVLGRNGALDSIDLILDGAEAQRVRDWLPARFALVEASTRSDSLEQMTEAFHINLLAMSLLSLLVAALLIYNTMTLSVLQRWHSLGIFRSQGVSREEIFLLILGEAAVLGVLASVAGVICGTGLGRLLVILVTRTIDDLYFNLSVTQFLLSPRSLLAGVGLGVGVTLLAATVPAWHAVRSKPVSLQHRAARDRQWQGFLPALLGLGLILMAAGFTVLIPERGTLVSGFAALMLVIFGFCFLVPAIMAAVLQGVLKLCGTGLGISSRMALRGISLGISRTGLAVAALTVALSVTVGVGVMVGSFRDTVQLWLAQSLAGDIQISSAAPESVIGAELPGLLARLDGVEDVRSAVLRQVETTAGPVRLQASNNNAAQSLYLKQAAPEQLGAYLRGDGILVSEPLGYLRNLDIGDSLDVFTDNGVRTLPILGIFYDYTSNLGMIAMHDSLYRRLWDDTSVNRLSLTLADDAGAGEVLASVRQTLGSQETEYQAVSNAEIRRVTLFIFDRTFAITNVLRLLAILVAFVGVLSALMALQLERLREFAILRASGMTPVQVGGLILVQTTVMGLFAGLLALPLGLLMSDILINVINRRSFGWSMQQLLPADVLVEGLLLALVAALLAGFYPALRAARIRPALALREE